MDAEIPDVAVYALATEDFGEGVLSRRQWYFRGELDPAFGELLGSGGNGVLLLTDLPCESRLDYADDALVAFDLDAHDAEAVPGEFSGRLAGGVFTGS